MQPPGPFVSEYSGKPARIAKQFLEDKTLVLIAILLILE